MTTKGTALFCGSFVAMAAIVALFGAAAGYFYIAGIVIGPSVYVHRWPWQL